jgi:hypothetical protein
MPNLFMGKEVSGNNFEGSDEQNKFLPWILLRESLFPYVYSLIVWKRVANYPIFSQQGCKSIAAYQFLFSSYLIFLIGNVPLLE